MIRIEFARQENTVRPHDAAKLGGGEDHPSGVMSGRSFHTDDGDWLVRFLG